MIPMGGLTDGEAAEVAGAGFTALTALAAFASVFRVERDRWRRSIPDFHIDMLGDIPNQEMRMTVANLGGPAREVRLMGSVGQYGWFTPTPPTTYWRPGESRTFRLGMPVVPGAMSYIFVEARDLRKQHLVVATGGGATYRWPLKEAESLSPGEEWRRLFPDQPAPLDLPYFPVVVEAVERNL